ncbi:MULTISPECIES: DUF502 domain-containing protein [unclassified Haladaptatus]|uniref:DUF502 domain-containing protein n=1 Tax=unclassified Haladaptatus TaxID=2622732 RepID=UPI0023E78FA2|nr:MULTISPECIES: DUF502 domain-containing protein [unclassified Haladaptatus]
MESGDGEANLQRGHAQGAKQRLRQVFLSGAALTIPLIITFIVLGFVIRFVSDILAPFVMVANMVWTINMPGYLVQATAIVATVMLIFIVGIISEGTSGQHMADRFHTLVEAIPGVGGVYHSFRRMSDVLIESDTQSFQEVKIVEFPHEGAYTIGFLTADTPEEIETAAGHSDMQTLFLPLAPNPVMGGFLVHLPADKVHDVDMTVEEGVRAIVTSGVAVGKSGESHAALSSDQLTRLTGMSTAGEVEPDDSEQGVTAPNSEGTGGQKGDGS